MAERWLVVGGGFQGIVGAYLLSRAGHDVVLIDGAKTGADLGGIMSSRIWKGFFLDFGCHLFANTDDKPTAVIMDLIGEDNVHPVKVSYASIINRQKTEGFAIPDLESYGEDSTRQILDQLLEAVAVCHAPSSKDLQGALVARFGPIAGSYLSDAARKMYQIEPTEISDDAFGMTLFQRIRIAEDSVADILKESPKLDARVASSSQADPMRFWRDKAQKFPFREFYPNQHGMRGFCERASNRLQELGTSLQLGQSVERVRLANDRASISLANGEQFTGDHVLWTSGIEALGKALGLGDSITRHIHHLPTVLYYFVIEEGTEGPYTYIHDYDMEDLVFRASAPGTYGTNVCPEGLSYVCGEVPTKLGSPLWNNPESFASQVWDEFQLYDVVRCPQPSNLLTMKAQSSYKLPKTGYRQAAAQFLKGVEGHPRLTLTDQWIASRNPIIVSLQETLSNV